MMPDELSRYIQDFARPRTSPHWRKGSFYSQNATYGEFYWELYEGPWYDFDHENQEVKIAFFLHGMHHLSIAYMLRTLFYHDSIWVDQLRTKNMIVILLLMLKKT
jgi:hypothetical protein